MAGQKKERNKETCRREEKERRGKRGRFVGAAVGIFSIAILTTGNYDEIYRRGYRDGEKDRNPAFHGK